VTYELDLGDPHHALRLTGVDRENLDLQRAHCWHVDLDLDRLRPVLQTRSDQGLRSLGPLNEQLGRPTTSSQSCCVGIIRTDPGVNDNPVDLHPLGEGHINPPVRAARDEVRVSDCSDVLVPVYQLAGLSGEEWVVGCYRLDLSAVDHIRWLRPEQDGGEDRYTT